MKKSKFSIEQLVDELKQVLDLLNLKKVHLFGVSKGTIVGQAFAGMYPERVLSVGGYGVVNIVSKLGEMDSTRSDFKDRLEAVNTFKEQFDVRINKKIFGPLMKKVYAPAVFLKEYNKLSIKQKFIFRFLSGKVYPMLEGTPLLTMNLLFSYIISDLGNEGEYFEKCIPNLKKIPLLFMNGTNDKTTPLHLVVKLLERLENATLVEFEDYGHIDPNLSKKKAYNIMDTYVSFLNKI
jgi:pimeloyl-ACP methyl ester carboxylesterase